IYCGRMPNGQSHYCFGQLRSALDRGSINRRYDVAALEASLGCRAIRVGYIADQSAASRFDSQSAGGRLVEVPYKDAEIASRYLAALDQLTIDLARLVRRNCKTDPNVTCISAEDATPAARRNDQGINPDNFAAHVYERAARVAWIDGGISLNVPVELGNTTVPASLKLATSSADDSCS